MMTAIDTLKRLFSTSFFPFVFARTLGLQATNALTPLKVMLFTSRQRSITFSFWLCLDETQMLPILCTVVINSIVIFHAEMNGSEFVWIFLNKSNYVVILLDFRSSFLLQNFISPVKFASCLINVLIFLMNRIFW